jgi:excisionase family DNA binding protein
VKRLTARQTCDRLGVSRRTLARYLDDGLLTPERTAGGHLRFDPAAVDELRERLAAAPATGPTPRPTELPDL